MIKSVTAEATLLFHILRYLLLEESVGFEPTDAFTSPVFKTGSFDRSDSSPFLATGFIIAKKRPIVNTFL